MGERTVSIYTFSKTYAMTGLRLGDLATPDATLRERIARRLLYTCSNVTSIVQFGGIGALEGPHLLPSFGRNCACAATCSTTASADRPRRAERPAAAGAFCVSPDHPEWQRDAAAASLSMVAGRAPDQARTGCVPVPISGRKARVISASARAAVRELRGALESMGNVFGISGARAAAS